MANVIYVLTDGTRSFNSISRPIYNLQLRAWECTDTNGVPFNIGDPVGTTFTFVDWMQYYTVTPPQFKMLIGVTKGQAIYASADAAVIYITKILDDPRLEAVYLGDPGVQGLLDLLISKGLLTSADKTAIVSATSYGYPGPPK